MQTYFRPTANMLLRSTSFPRHGVTKHLESLYLGGACRLYVVVRGAVKERAQSAIDGIPHHREKLVIPPLVDKCVPEQRGEWRFDAKQMSGMFQSRPDKNQPRSSPPTNTRLGKQVSKRRARCERMKHLKGWLGCLSP